MSLASCPVTHAHFDSVSEEGDRDSEISEKRKDKNRERELQIEEKRCVAQGDDEIVENEEEKCVSKNNASLRAWYFGFKPTDVAQANAICRTCRVVVQRIKDNTTNLFSHLKNHHKTLR